MRIPPRSLALLFALTLFALPVLAQDDATADTTFTMSAEEMAEYDGEYELAPGFILAISSSEGKIFGQATGQGAAEIFPSETDEFYYKIVDAQLRFNRDAEGNIESLTLHQGGQNIPGKKIK